MLTVLGSVTMTGRDGNSVAVSGREGVLLAALLVRRGQVVAVDRLIDLIWEGGGPPTARRQVAYCVHRLRAKFSEQVVPAAIVTTTGGYLLEADAEVVDGPLFERTVRRAADLAARGEARAAAQEYRAALKWWRGSLLDGMPRPLQDEAWAWEELRLAAQERCLDLELTLGEHRRLVGELRTLVHANPMHEGFWRLLMLALYRSGRPADALDVYQEARTRLLAELGAEPGAELKELEAAILADDQALMIGAPEPAPSTMAPPRQLPAAAPAVVGRQELTAELIGLVSAENGPVVNLTGMPGVGKSALAVRVAHQVSARFPDGQLYLSFGTSQTAYDAMAVFLRGLGVHGPEIPAGEDDRARLYQRLLAGRRILLVLDDVHTAAQVASLIPETTTCAVLITSQAPVFGTVQLMVDPLSAEGALAMLRTLLGAGRVDAEAEHAAALVRAVGGLPLALRVTAAKLLTRPHWSLRSMADRLADQQERLDELSHGEMVVRGSLLVAFEGLDRQAATLLVRASRLDADALPEWVAAAVLDVPVERARAVVERLVAARLVERVGAHRFRFHELVRIFAAEQTDEPVTPLVETVVSGWLGLAEEAHRALYGGDYARLHSEAPWHRPVAVAEVRRDPLGWLENERLNLCAAVGQAARAGLAHRAWRLAVALVSLFEARGFHDDWQRTHGIALEAALAAGDDRGAAAVLCSLGSLYLCQHKLRESRETTQRAESLFSVVKDEQGLAMAHRGLGLLDRQRDLGARAEARYRRALDGFVSTGDVVAQAGVRALVAQVALDSGDFARAEHELGRALALCHDVESPRVEAQVRYKLGKVLSARGDHEAAEQVLAGVVGLVRRSRDAIGESFVLHALGRLHADRDDLPAAARSLERAAMLCEENRDRVGAARVWRDLSGVLRREGRVRQAGELAERADAVLAEHRLLR